VALVALSANRILFAANAVIQLYSLAKSTQWKFIRFDRTHLTNLNSFDEGPLKYVIFYFARIIPAAKNHGSSDEDSCSICSGEKSDVQFCDSGHHYGIACVAGHIYAQTQRIINNISNISINLVAKRQMALLQNVGLNTK